MPRDPVFDSRNRQRRGKWMSGWMLFLKFLPAWFAVMTMASNVPHYWYDPFVMGLVGAVVSGVLYLLTRGIQDVLSDRDN